MLQYTVQEGDTVESITRLFVVSEDDFRRVNHIPNGGEVTPERRILIPPQREAP
jgi:spore germination protein YaaH